MQHAYLLRRWLFIPFTTPTDTDTLPKVRNTSGAVSGSLRGFAETKTCSCSRRVWFHAATRTKLVTMPAADRQLHCADEKCFQERILNIFFEQCGGLIIAKRQISPQIFCQGTLGQMETINMKKFWRLYSFEQSSPSCLCHAPLDKRVWKSSGHFKITKKNAGKNKYNH